MKRRLPIHLPLGFMLLTTLLATLLARAQGAPTVPGQASLSPDGSRIVYQKKTSSGWKLYLSKLDGSGLKALTNGPGDDADACWRSDGAAIAFASHRAGNWDLFSIRPDGTNLRQLTRTRQDERAPQWSPRPFGLFDVSEISQRTVADRSMSNVAPGDLKMLQMLATKSNDWDLYKSSFGKKPRGRYYKLLFTTGSGDKQRVGTMRDNGAFPQVLPTGLAGAHAQPCWERTAMLIAFMVRKGGVQSIYQAAYPKTSELDESGTKPRYGLSAETSSEFKQSIKRLGQTAPGAQIMWTPNGQYLAVAAGKTLRFLPQNGSKLAPFVQNADSPLPPGAFTWLKDARTAVFGSAASGNAASGNAAGRISLRTVSSNNPLLDVLNIADFEDLKAEDRVLLARNGFVAGGTTGHQMFHVYETTDYDDLPIFVTTDAVLHLNHLVFDYLLRTVESERLMPSVVAITNHYLGASLQQVKNAPNAQIAAAARANAAFFAVAARLARGEVRTGIKEEAPADPDDVLAKDRAAISERRRQKQAASLKQWTQPLQQTLAAMPAETAGLVNAELKLIAAHSGMEESPLFGGQLSGAGQADAPLLDTRIDYSNFMPRGHYGESEVLRRYFLLTRWLTAGAFGPSSDLTRRAALLLAAGDEATLAQWRKVQQVMGVFVGDADDADLDVYDTLAKAIYGRNPTLADVSDEAKLQTFVQRAAALPAPRIAPGHGTAFRFLPAPFTPDAAIMQGLVYDRNAPDVGTEDQPRFFALGLDVMAVLGSPRAHQILQNTTFQGSFFNFDLKETQYAGYDAQFNALRAQFGAMTQADWSRNLYTRTLHALVPLLKPQPSSQYKFTQSPAWIDKNLNTALGAWTELKHDTLPKQPASLELGGASGIEEAPIWQQPVGFVEPAPEVLQRLEQLVGAERSVLQQAGFLTPAISQRLSTFAALLSMLRTLEAKQRAGVPLNAREIEQLRFFGGYQEHLTFVTAEGEGGSVGGNDMALVADVSTAFSTRLNQLLVLEEGVGRAVPIYVAVERDGHRELARGAVFSYYEFAHPAEDRLTDEKWRQLLDSKKAPQLPTWTSSFISRIGGVEGQEEAPEGSN